MRQAFLYQLFENMHRNYEVIFRIVIYIVEPLKFTLIINLKKIKTNQVKNISWEPDYEAQIIQNIFNYINLCNSHPEHLCGIE